jgi:hypothetical protein
MKDCDVTWLYGPLQTATSQATSQQTSEPASNISKNNSFLNKKPILKKRSVSEMMLQKSLSNSSLVRQAAAAAQLSRRPYAAMSRRASDMTEAFSFSRETSREGTEATDYFSSRSTSGFQSPIPEQNERKHIRFDNKVEQCIAVDIKDADDDDHVIQFDRDDSSSEDGLIMMRQSRRWRPKPRSRRTSTSDSKTIAKLPSTTLKDRLESPSMDPQSHSIGTGLMWRPRLSPSPSAETLRPSNPDRNFLIGEEDEEDDEDPENQFPRSFGKLQLNHIESNFQEEDNKKLKEQDERLAGLRRTESGMFMPLEEDDPQFGGIVGRVLDTVNTARDIAHVIWNVGWRK